MAFLPQCYSVRGRNAVAGINIANTINNVFNVVFIALGDAVAIIIGAFGAGRMKEAKDTDTKIIAFSVFSSAVMAVLMFKAASMFPNLYNTTPEETTCHAVYYGSGCIYAAECVYACYIFYDSPVRDVGYFLL